METPICFISYARENILEAQILYRRLREAGLNPWMDKPPPPYKLDGLRPGELWEDRLREVIRTCKYFLPLFSTTSVEKSGYVQSEFRQALVRLAEIPAGKTFVIPIRIDECEIPRARIDGISFRQYNYIDCMNGYFSDLVAHISSLEGRDGGTLVHRQIEAHSANEFLEAIGSHTEIIVKKSFSLTGVDIPDNPHIYAREVFDGEELVFAHLENLTIKGDGLPEISVSPRYATVINFEASNGVNIDGVALGHRPDIGECTGAVINFSSCSSISVTKSRLFGCGTYGFELSDCEIVQVADCNIFDCSYGFFVANNVESLRLRRVNFHHNLYFTGMQISNSAASFEACKLMDNKPAGDNSVIFHLYRSKIVFSETIIETGDLSRLGISGEESGLTVLLRAQ